MNSNKLKKISTKKRSILVVGDLALDRYLYGNTNGLSPEGPHPIVLNPTTKYMLGCGANVLNNIKTMFPFFSVDAMGIVGDDLEASIIVDMLKEKNVGTKYILTTKDHPTVLKSRLVADGKTIARWDVEDSCNVDKKLEFQLITILQAIAKNYECLVFSDYNKGIVTEKLVTTARLNKKENCMIMVDPKKDFNNFKGVDLIKPNLKELESYGKPSGKLIPLKDVLNQTRQRYGIKNILLTMASKGMSLHTVDSYFHFSTNAKSIMDITGAGDVVISAMAGFHCGGLSLEDSAKLANIAAGISISRHGTSTVTLEEIEELL